MTGARDDVLGMIRRRLGRTASAERVAAVRQGLAQPRRNLVPARGQLPHDEQVALFVRMAREAAATVDRVGAIAEVAPTVASFLTEHALGTRVRLAPALAGLAWPGLETSAGAAGADDAVSIVAAFAGVAETGTLVLLSGPDSPTTLNFLPDTHIVLLSVANVVGLYEDAWDRLRRRGSMPRNVNMVTGPSRTGDIEQTIQLGAHGPRRLHVILVDGPIA